MFNPSLKEQATAPSTRSTRVLVGGTCAQILSDCAAWAVGLTFATLARYDFDTAGIGWSGLVGTTAATAAVQILAGLAGGLYRRRWRFGSFEELAVLARVVLCTCLVAVVLERGLVSFRPVPSSALVGGAVAAFVVMGGIRYGWRLLRERRLRPAAARAKAILVFGAGEGGAQLITAMLRNPTSPYLPVGLIDDDPDKRQLRIGRVRVLGDRHAIPRAARDTDARRLLIAVPSASAELVRSITTIADRVGLEVKVVPPIGELMTDDVGLGDIRDLTTADLLGRREIDTDLGAIAGYVTGRRVLVTGAGGSIGSELCRQLYRFAPAELVMLDRDESALHAVQLTLHGRALLEDPNLLLLDIRDRAGLRRALRERRPEVVFHAAALKHLSLLEGHPSEALQTNVEATLALLEAAADAGVERFVNVSTDKAADPTSVLGYSKRVAERLTAYFALHHQGMWISVRFGNVLGSRGSVLTTFRSQIESGGPVTVTHPDVTRYFMTVEEAVQLLIQAGAVRHAVGHALVLEMGEPVRIAEFARQLVAMSGREVEIVFTGLRQGEKLHEVLLGEGEPDVRPHHPLISQVPVPALDPAQLRELLVPGADTRELLRLLCVVSRGDVAARRARAVS